MAKPHIVINAKSVTWRLLKMDFENRDKRINEIITLIHMYLDLEVEKDEIERFIKNVKKIDGLDFHYLVDGVPFGFKK